MTKMFLFQGWMNSAKTPAKKYGYMIAGGAIAILALGGLVFFYLARTESDVPSSAVYEQEMMGTPLTVEVADTPEARARGLSGRTDLPEGYGMLFVFDQREQHGFWMKDMQIPIDIFWLADDGVILGIEENVQPDTYPDTFYPPVPVRYVLETRAGHAQALSLSKGDRMPGILLSDHVAR